MIRHRLKGLLAAVGILGILVGLPAVLLAVGFGVLPTITTWSDVVALALRPDDGTLALLLLKGVGWVSWVILALLLLIEVVARLRGIRPRDLPGLGLPQAAARSLVATAAALFIALPSSAAPAVASPVAPATPVATTPPAGASSSTASRQAPTDVPGGPTARMSRPTRTHTVTRGESLWSIAENELGNGRRYPEIADLNAALLDGRGDGFLKPGWVLTLPSAPGHGTTKAPVNGHDGLEKYTVRKGDTLSEIALDHLGTASAYPRIYQASRGITQPDGRHLTDPDRINVGWTLNLPHAHTAPGDPPQAHITAPPAETKAPTPSVPTASAPESRSNPPEASSPAEASPASSAPVQPSVQTPAAAENGDQTILTPAWQLSGLVGAGMILGASMWLALRRRRAAQFRARRPGRMIAPTAPAIAPVEKTLATAGASAAPTVEFLDEALRRLATRQGRAGQPMPAVAAMEVTSTHVRLHLSSACDLPAPWEPAPDPLHWQLTLDLDLDEVGPLDPSVPAPYPQLVTIGADDQEGRWLLNLEDVAVLTLTGDPVFTHDFARYVAAELALNPWSRDVTVECVGVASEIVPLNPRRVRHHENADIAAGLLADTVAMIDRTTQANLDVATGRATLLDDDLWDARILLLDSGLHTETTLRLTCMLREHPQRTGTAVVLIGDQGTSAGGEVIEITSAGRLRMTAVGLDLEAVGLTSDEAAGCAALFAQAGDPDDVAMPEHDEDAQGWRAHSNQAGQLRTDHVLPRDEIPAEPAASLLPESDEHYTAVAATTTDDLATLAPRVPLRVRHQVEKSDPTLDDDVGTWFDPDCDLPKLALLGPLTVQASPTGKATVAAGRKPYLNELVAYLATRAHGATTEEVAEAMQIPVDRVRKDILALRTWLGHNPRSGRPHIPDNRHTAAAEARGVNAYEVEGLLVDADLFRRLRVRGESRGAAGIDDLKRALSLVTGTPFTRLRKDGYAWLYEGERLDQILLCAIVDVAHLVTTACLRSGELSAAMASAELAVRAAPDEETPRLDLAAALEAHGHLKAARHLLKERVCNRGDDEDHVPAELPTRTEWILGDGKRWRTGPDRRTSA